jgi:hypothetical protein
MCSLVVCPVIRHFFTVVMQRLYHLSSNCADHLQFEGAASKSRRPHRTRDSLSTGVPHIIKSFPKVTPAQRAYGSHILWRAECMSDQSLFFFPPLNKSLSLVSQSSKTHLRSRPTRTDQATCYQNHEPIRPGPYPSTITISHGLGQWRRRRIFGCRTL